MLYRGNCIHLSVAENGVATLCFDAAASAVNKFDLATVNELSQALDALEAATQAKALILSSGKSSFVVGADITEFLDVFAAGASATAEHLALNNQNFNRIEDFPGPTVAIIDGYALGGGFEVALACDYRVASDEALVGLPETTLGIMPGWGGSVRLPRLIGLQESLQWMCQGKPSNAGKALKAGALDQVVPSSGLVAEAEALLQRCLSGELDYRMRREEKLVAGVVPLGGLPDAGQLRAGLSPHYIAPAKVVDTVLASFGEARAQALALETEAFGELSQGYQARALVGVFLNEQLVSKKARERAKTATRRVRKCAVLGAGIMGGGIAYQSASRGVSVIMKDIAQAGIDLGMKEAEKLLQKRVDRGQISEPERQKVLQAISPTLAFAGFDEVDIVVEAVVENPGIKRKVLAEVEGNIPVDALLASNTSTISIAGLAQGLARPANFCGMHFFNPVHAMPLVEVIVGPETSADTVATTVDFALALGKKPVVVQDCPGFLVNRVLFPYLRALSLLVQDGVSFQRVDQVMESWGWPMGPAYLLDVIGMDTTVHAEAVLAEGFPERMAVSAATCTDLLYKAGLLGQKTGAGFYQYSRDAKGRPSKTVNPEALALFQALAAESTQTLSDDDILHRMMIPMVTELARCLDEGVVGSPAEADMALLYGLGFPRFRGGVLHWVDEIGLSALAEVCERWSNLGGLYQLPSDVVARAAAGEGFYR